VNWIQRIRFSKETVDFFWRQTEEMSSRMFLVFFVVFFGIPEKQNGPTGLVADDRRFFVFFFHLGALRCLG